MSDVECDGCDLGMRLVDGEHEWTCDGYMHGTAGCHEPGHPGGKYWLPCSAPPEEEKRRD